MPPPEKQEKKWKVVATFKKMYGTTDPTPVYRITLQKSMKAGTIIKLDPTENEVIYG